MNIIFPMPSPWQTLLIKLLWFWLLWVPHSTWITQYLSFCDWLTSLGIMLSRFFHAVTDDRISLFLKAEEYSIIFIYHTFFTTHLSMDTSCFHIRATVIGSEMNTGVKLSLWDSYFSSVGQTVRNEITELYSISTFNVLRYLYTFSIAALSFCVQKLYTRIPIPLKI